MIVHTILDLKLKYLASPYSHPNYITRRERAKEICYIASRLQFSGHYIYCPIAETVMIAKYGNLKNTSWEYFRAADLIKLNRCDELFVCTMDGWDQSRGVRGEIKFALTNEIPISLVNPKTIEVKPTSFKELKRLLNITCVGDLND